MSAYEHETPGLANPERHEASAIESGARERRASVEHARALGLDYFGTQAGRFVTALPTLAWHMPDLPAPVPELGVIVAELVRLSLSLSL